MSTGDQLTQFIVSGLTTGSIYALIALGFCIIHNAIGIVNFTQVDFVTLGGMMMYTFFQSMNFPMPLAFVLGVLAVTAVGALVERFAIRPAKSRAVIVLIFITIGVSILMRGAFKIIWGTNQMALPSFSGDAPFLILRAAVLPQSLWIFVITVIVVILLHFFFSSTRLGKAMRATSFNPKAAALMGVNVNRMILFSFALSGALGAVAGIIIVPITTLSYDIGVILGLKGFAAAVSRRIREQHWGHYRRAFARAPGVLRCRDDLFYLQGCNRLCHPSSGPLHETQRAIRLWREGEDLRAWPPAYPRLNAY